MPDDNGAQAQFETAFHGHKHSVYDFAVRMLGSRDAAADVVQEVFVRFYRALSENGEAIQDTRSWLFIVNRNLCLKQIRSRRNDAPLETAENLPDLENHSLDPDHRDLRTAMAGLEPKHREALLLREYSGFTYREMGEILEISEPAVKSLLYKSRAQLREVFTKIKAQRDRYEVR